MSNQLNKSGSGLKRISWLTKDVRPAERPYESLFQARISESSRFISHKPKAETGLPVALMPVMTELTRPIVIPIVSVQRCAANPPVL